MMKKLIMPHGAAPLVIALALGLLSSCPDMLNKPNSRASGEGLVHISLVAAEGGALSSPARTAMPQPGDLFFTLEFSGGGAPVTEYVERVASINLSLPEGTWSLTVTGYSDSGRTMAVLTGSVPVVSITPGGTSFVTVELSGSADTGTGRIAYALSFPNDVPDTIIGVLTLNNYDGSHVKTVDLLATDGSNTCSVDGGLATATGTITLPAGYYQILAEITNTTGSVHAGYTDLVHVYDQGVTPLAKEFASADFSGYTPVTTISLDSFVALPVRDFPPIVNPITAAAYTGTIAWKENDGITGVGSVFTAPGVYKAVVTLRAVPGHSFAGLTANVFTYSSSPTAKVTNPAGTGTTMTVVITFPLPEPGLRYVKESPAGLGNGITWDNASGDLQKMLDEAHADKQAHSSISAIVRVAAGTYKPLYAPSPGGASVSDAQLGDYYLTARDKTFILRPGVELWGGYPPDAANATPDTERDWAAHRTILSGDLDNNDTTSIVGDNAYHVVLGVDIPDDGTTKLDGFTVKGGNAFGETWIAVNGKSINPTDGGGIYNYSSSPVLTNVTVSGNKANGDGGGIYNNTPPSSPVLTNVTIAGNSASSGGGIYNESSSPKIRNSIIWRNSDGMVTNSATPEVDYSIVQGGGYPGSNPVSGSNYNLTVDPLFVFEEDADNAPTTGGDYRLESTSPAIDAGSNTYYTSGTPDLSSITTDLDNTARITGTAIDMGAYESSHLPGAQNFYVREGVNGTGSSWATASGDLQDMIDAAHAQGGGVVRVAAGTYKPLYAPSSSGNSVPDAQLAAKNLSVRDKTFILRPGVEIRGGYTAAGEAIDEATRKARFNAAGEPTAEIYRAILSGDIDGVPDGGNPLDGFTGMDGNAHHVVFGVNIPDDGGTILDGFTVKGGNADGDGGEYITVIGNLAFRNRGGGIYNHDSSPVLTNVTIAGNSADDGGGIYNTGSGSSPVLTNVTIAGNSAGHSGGGIYNNVSSSPVLTNLTIAGNSSGNSGGGIFNAASSPVLTNVTIAGNSSTGYGGGICNSYSSPVLTNVTIAGNSSGGSGGGIYSSGTGSTTIRNSIIWGNSTSIFVSSNSTPELYHSIIQGGWTGPGNNNLHSDPRFVAPQGASDAPATGGDYRLENTSPAIDMGNNDYYPDTWAKWDAMPGDPVITPAVYEKYVRPALEKDAGGADRFKDAHTDDSSMDIDIGAFEEQGGAITLNFLGYVKANGTGGGTSWADASGDLQAVIDQAGRALRRGATEATVRAAAGTYKPRYAPAPDGSSVADFAAYPALTARDRTFMLRPGVKILGGYPANATNATGDGDRNWTAHRTILSGDLDNNNALSGGDAYHVVLGVDIPDNDKTILDGFVIQGGRADGPGTIAINITGATRFIGRDSGGGMHNHLSWPELTNLTITGNDALAYGGGLYNYYSSPVLTDAAIRGNRAFTHGGGLYNVSSSPVLTRVDIEDNLAEQRGGGLYNNVSSPVLTNLTIAGNSAGHSGGGIYNNASSSPVLTSVTIAGNSAGHSGGGLYNASSSSPVLIYAAITENTAGSLGGGVYNAFSFPALTSLTIAGNSAGDSGGGIYNLNSTPVLANVAITGNSAVSLGGGVYTSSSSSLFSFNMINVTIAGNRAGDGGGIYNNPTLATLTIKNSVVWGNSSGINEDGNAVTINQSIVQRDNGTWPGSQNIDPKFVAAENVSSAPTTGGNYRLQSASPGINAGSETYYPNQWSKWLPLSGIVEEIYLNHISPALSYDAGGQGRFSAAIDLGAYEHH
jgi:predicted outer membrane repeat protein